MRTLRGQFLRFVLSLALVLSALPIRAGVVCVVDAHVVARCERACCAPKARVHCETVYRKGGTVLAPLAKSAFPVLAPITAPTSAPSREADGGARSAPAVLGDEPVFARPRPPDRGRAPPFPSRSPSSTTR